MSEKILFALPVGDDGSVTVTEPQKAVYLLTFFVPPDNRLRTPLCKAFIQALDIVETTLPRGVVVTTSSSPKFYSNGLDLQHAADTKGFYNDCLFKLYARLAAFPMPTVALINGHAFAGGFMLAMHHDYRVMNPKRGYLCMNEIEFGAPLKPAMLCVFDTKVAPNLYREIILEAKRFGGPAALEAGLVDKTGAWEQVLELIEERKLSTKAESGAYGVLKHEMYRKSLVALEGWEAQNGRDEDAMNERRNRWKAEKEESVAAWKQQGKSKL